MTTLTQSGDPGLVEVVENQRFFAAWCVAVGKTAISFWQPEETIGELSRAPTCCVILAYPTQVPQRSANLWLWLASVV